MLLSANSQALSVQVICDQQVDAAKKGCCSNSASATSLIVSLASSYGPFVLVPDRLTPSVGMSFIPAPRSSKRSPCSSTNYPFDFPTQTIYTNNDKHLAPPPAPDLICRVPHDVLARVRPVIRNSIPCHPQQASQAAAFGADQPHPSPEGVHRAFEVVCFHMMSWCRCNQIEWLKLRVYIYIE